MPRKDAPSAGMRSSTSRAGVRRWAWLLSTPFPKVVVRSPGWCRGWAETAQEDRAGRSPPPTPPRRRAEPSPTNIGYEGTGRATARLSRRARRGARAGRGGSGTPPPPPPTSAEAPARLAPLRTNSPSLANELPSRRPIGHNSNSGPRAVIPLVHDAIPALALLDDGGDPRV